MLKELYAQRAKLVSENRAVLTLAETDKRHMSGEETAAYDLRDKEIESISQTIDRCERQKVREEKMDAAVETIADRVATAAAGTSETAGEFETFAYRFANGRERSFTIRDAKGIRDAWKHVLSGGAMHRYAALQQDNPTQAGYLVAPQMFVAQLIKAIDNLTVIRQLATTYTVTGADSLGAPSLDTDVEDGTWTGEITSADEDTALAVGKRTFKPLPLAKRILVSRTLMRNSAIPMEQFIRDRLAYKFAVTHETAFMTGTGATTPLGVFTAHASGIDTDRDTNISSSSGVINETGAGGFITALETLKDAYQRNAVWIMHRVFRGQLRKLKSSTGEWLWQDGLVAGTPTTFIGRPVYSSEYAPSTATTANYCAIVGDFSYYWIVDGLNVEVQRLDELSARTNQVEFIARSETDGMPVLSEAFARCKLLDA